MKFKDMMIFASLMLFLSVPSVSSEVSVSRDGFTISSDEQFYCQPVESRYGCLIDSYVIIENQNPDVSASIRIDSDKQIYLREYVTKTARSVGTTLESIDDIIISSGRYRYPIRFYAKESGKFNFTITYLGTEITLDPYFNVTYNTTSPTLHLLNGIVSQYDDIQFGSINNITDNELSDSDDSTSFDTRISVSSPQIINITDGSSETYNSVQSTGDKVAVNITIGNNNLLSSFKVCARAGKGSSIIGNPNISIGTSFTRYQLSLPTTQTPQATTCTTIPRSILSNGSQLVGFGCTPENDCGAPASRHLYIASDDTAPITGKSFLVNPTPTKQTGTDYFIHLDYSIENITTGKAIRTSFPLTLNSENLYWMQTRKITSGISDIYVWIYHEGNGSLSSLITTFPITTGDDIVPLDIIQNVSASFRIYTNSSHNISELSLIESVNDSSVPVIDTFSVNSTSLSCGEYARMSSNVTDDNIVQQVIFHFDDNVSNIQEADKIIDTDIFFVDKQYSHITDGVEIYNFTLINATDLVLNEVTEDPSLQFNYTCIEEDDDPPSLSDDLDNLIFLGNDNISFTTYCYDNFAHNLSVSLYNTTDILSNVSNTTSLMFQNISVSTFHDISSVGEGNYTIDMFCDDGNFITSNSKTITVLDVSVPILISPTNGSSLEIFENQFITFQYSISDDAVCSLYLNSSLISSETVSSGANSFTYMPDENNTFLWHVSCTTGSLVLNSSSFLLSVIFSEFNQALNIGRCNKDTGSVLLLWIMIAVSLVMILFGVISDIPIFTFFGGIMIMISSWYFVACASLFAYILALLGILMVIHSAVRGFFKR